MPRFLSSLTILCILQICVVRLQATEPWADPKLPVKDGLELWLDASKANGNQKNVSGKLLQWQDGSGKKRHLRQEAKEAQPTLLQIGKSALVRFDGMDNHFRLLKQNMECSTWTVIVVAAPWHNLGGFQGLLSFNATGEKDYTSGLNIDLGPNPSATFSVVNIEGRGFGGAKNLRKKATPFGKLYTLAVSSNNKVVRLAIDGQPEGERTKTEGTIRLDEFTLGARNYNNAGGPQLVQGFGRFDVAEVLIYNRDLSEEENKHVYAYLATKYADLKSNLPPNEDGRSEHLVPVSNPPAVQMFFPGFTVREIPVSLSNINNIQYRTDGTLVALAYNGDIWLLKDSNQDGIEDQAELFWESKGRLRAPIGMDLTPPGYKHGNGVFVASKGKISLIVDTDNDNKADKEIIVADGWKEIVNNVDALGVAIDPKDGSIYCGRGCFDFTNAYRIDKQGKSAYSLKDEPGTVLRITPDFQSREIIATGIRFPVALRFNRYGDLFASDQEGATWMPNGNPLDELLHIQKNRHYGFPPRHPKHLPNVIDEPSTFDYGPQHQSNCGLNFNEPVNKDGPTFGPKHWVGDAILSGYSRGKLYRTQLIRSKAGYVARTQLMAALNMLTVDACVGPKGELVVACHSGGPDWGSGPTGKGKLFQVTYTDANHPQPVLAWPSSSREIRVEFDRPVEPSLLRDVLRQTKVTAGKFVRAGDRFETFWPGYAVVQAQKVTPRYDVPVRSAQLTADRRTLVLATDPYPSAVHYAITLPGMGRPALEQTPKNRLPQHPAIDFDLDLSGCTATWTPADGSPIWNGWLPHPDLQVAKELTTGSTSHDELWKAMTKAGELRLQMQMDLSNMLRPAIQMGSRIDYEYAPETVILHLESSANIQVHRLGTNHPTSGTRHSLTVNPQANKTIPLEISLKKPAGVVTWTCHWSTKEDDRQRPFALHRILVPWANTNTKIIDVMATAELAPELKGGSWARGRKEFFGEQAACSKCHAIEGQGPDIGPDLSNLIHRDYPSVLRDITNPSFAINPDHLTYTVQLKDGRTLMGVVRSTDNLLRIGDTKGIITEVNRHDVEELKPSPISTMPEGLPKLLGPDRMRDLMTYLLTPPPSMPKDYVGKRPKPRTLAEVHAVLKDAPNPPEKTRPIRIVLVAGPKDHGKGEHDYPAWQKAWKELLTAGEKVEVVTAWEWPDKEEFSKADVMVIYQQGDWNANRATDMDAFLERGGGMVFIHWAVSGRKQNQDFAKRIGLASGGPIRFRHGDLTLNIHQQDKHPVMRNFNKLAMTDESYWKLVGHVSEDRVLATSIEDQQPQPQIWSLERGLGRIFVSIPGHYSWTFDDPLFRVLLLRGIAWSAKEPVDRFNDLIWPGAEMTK